MRIQVSHSEATIAVWSWRHCFSTEVNQLGSRHDPLTEGGNGVLVHTHVVPFGQRSVCNENKTSCFGQKHNGFIQKLQVFFGRSQIEEIIYDDQITVQDSVPVGFLPSGGNDEIFFGAVDRRGAAFDRFFGDQRGKRCFTRGAFADDHDILYAVAKVDFPDLFQLPPQAGGDPCFIKYFFRKAGRPVDVVRLFLCPQFRFLF